MSIADAATLVADGQAGAPARGVCVGTAKGPGQSPHEYTFITPDREMRVKQGEFVYYELAYGGETLQVIGRVSGRRPVRLYPDTFMADPEVPPGQVAAVLGFDSEEYELFEVTVTVMGYYDARLKTFVNPRVPPRSGWPVYLVPGETLAEVLSRRRPGEVGSAEIGWLLSRPRGEVPITLSVKDLTGTHLAIIAGTGAGKSYLASVIIEELMKPVNRACVLIVDPHGEYDTLVEMQGHPAFTEGDLLSGYTPEVQVLRPEHVKVRTGVLSLHDWYYLLPDLSERMRYVFGRAFRRLQRERGDRFTKEDLVAAVQSIRADGREDEAADPDVSGGALTWRIQNLVETARIISDYEDLKLRDLFRPGQCTVLQLNEIEQRQQQVILSVLLRRLYRARVDTERRLIDERDERYLPYPVFVLIEEAHRFAPANADVVSTQILKEILAEGRKFGVGVGLISQRPGKLDADVLSQCMTQCIMRIVNPIDQNAVASAVESVGRDLLAELPGLSKGQVIVSGAALNTPVLCQVRERLTRHGGEDKDAPAEWLAFFQDRSRERRREREALLPSDGGFSIFLPTDE